MAIETEKLLALKAFYMGLDISKKYHVQISALSMVDAAIAQLKDKHELENKVRLVFYHLLRAEILRHGGSPVNDRDEAQRICREIHSPLYEYSIRIAKATTGTKKLDGIQNLTIVEEKIKRSEAYEETDGWNSWVNYIDLAMQSLEVSEYDLANGQKRFLNKVNLREMITKHEIGY